MSMLLSYISASHEMSSRNRYFPFHLWCGVWSNTKKNRIHHMKISNKNSFFVKSISRKFREIDFTKKISNFFPYQTSSLLSTLYHHKSESAAETVNVMIDSHFATAALEIWLRVLQYATDKSLCTFLEKNHSAPHCSINATNNSFDFDGILFFYPEKHLLD